jgi:hypothetical protein
MHIVQPKGCHHTGHMISHGSQHKRLRQTEVLLYQSLWLLYTCHTFFIYGWKYLSVDMLIFLSSQRTLLSSLCMKYDLTLALCPNFCRVSASVFCLCDFLFYLLFLFVTLEISFLRLKICLHLPLSISTVLLHISKVTV